MNAIQQESQVSTIKHQQTVDDACIKNMKQPLVIVGTAKGLWLLDGEQQVELDGYEINALAPSADGLWAIANHISVMHRDLQGQWHNVTSVDKYQLNCLLALNEGVLLGTSEAHLIQLTHGNLTLVEGFEQAEGRDKWYTPWSGPPDVRSMAIGESGEIYVNVHVGGILRSSVSGQDILAGKVTPKWQPTIDFHADVHEVRTVHSRPGLVLAATAEGLATSMDQGSTWDFDRANLHATYSRAVVVGNETILMTTSTGPHGNKAAIYRRPLNQPGEFEKCQQGLPEWFSGNIDTSCLAALENNVAFGTKDGQVFISNDTGLMWQRLAAGLAPIRCLTLIYSSN